MPNLRNRAHNGEDKTPKVTTRISSSDQSSESHDSSDMSHDMTFKSHESSETSDLSSPNASLNASKSSTFSEPKRSPQPSLKNRSPLYPSLSSWKHKDINKQSAVCTPTSTCSSAYYFIGIPLLVVALSCGFCLLNYCSRSPHPSPAPASESILQLFMEHFQNLKNSFQSQSTVLWRILRAGTKPIMDNDEPIQPAVFIIVVPSDAIETADCLVRKFSEMITKLFGAEEPVEFFSKFNDNLMPEEIKLQIETELSRGLSSGSRVAIVHHLERIPSESAMMFHAFCDNDNAPYRRAVFIMTLYVDELSSSIPETDDFVESWLEALWGEQLGSNRYQPLFSRIGGSNAFVRPESITMLKQNKC